MSPCTPPNNCKALPRPAASPQTLCRVYFMGLFQILSVIDFGKNAHLLNGDFVQLLETLGLGDSVLYHDGIDILHVRNADELVDGGVVALVALERRIC